jgi:hypothetical protein
LKYIFYKYCLPLRKWQIFSDFNEESSKTYGKKAEASEAPLRTPLGELPTLPQIP